jgi:hypothetical protein
VTITVDVLRMIDGNEQRQGSIKHATLPISSYLELPDPMRETFSSKIETFPYHHRDIQYVYDLVAPDISRADLYFPNL